MKSVTKKTPPQGVQKRPKITLRKLPDVRKLLARVINENLAGQMTDGQLRAVSYACQTLCKTMETIEIENRLDRLEEELSRGK
jgi:hypothetical protein